MSDIKTIRKATSCLGATIYADVPATAEDWDLATGTPGDCVSTAIGWELPRAYLTPIRNAQIAALVDAGHQRKVVDTKNGKDVLESQEKFVERLKAEGAITAVDLQKLTDKVITDKNITFCKAISGTSRAAIGESWLNSAADVIAKWQSGEIQPDGEPASVERSLRKIRAVLPGATIDDPSDVTAIAMLLRDLDKAVRANAAI